MSELIETINSDEEVDYLDDSDDEFKEKIFTKKDREEMNLFNSELEFNEEDPFLDPIGFDSGLSMAKKKKKRTTLQEKINKVLNDGALTQPVGDSNKMDTTIEDASDEKSTGVDDDVIEDDELPAVVDSVKDRHTTIKKKITETDEFFENWVKPDDEDEKDSFADYGFERKLLKALANVGWTTPTPIQKASIPVAVTGRDICACATTGSGKTGAFVLPILQRFALRDPSKVESCTRVLVLLPTRELCVQVFAVFRKLVAELENVTVACAAGGLDLVQQTQVLRRDPDILVATPGRLIDHLHNTPNFSLQEIEILVLDEADRMLDEFFASQMKEILSQTCKTRQTMLFSATMTDTVQELTDVALTKPMKIFISSNTDVADGLEQQFVRIRPGREGDREAMVAALLTRSFPRFTLLFTQTRKMAHRMHILLGLLGLKVVELHGSMSQTARLEALANFKNGTAHIMVCTDVAARGLDIPSVRTVINMTLPNNYKSYVHRVGRTARAGKQGRSISLVGESEWKILKMIIKASKTSCKTRTLATEVVTNFKTKLNEYESKVKKIIDMENEEAALAAIENQVNAAKNKLEQGPNEKRGWFQTKYERELEKADRMLDAHSGIRNRNTRGKQKNKIDTNTPEGRAQLEMQKADAFRHREQKREKKGNRVRALGSEQSQKEKAEAREKKLARKDGKKNRSGFARDLADVTQKAVKFHRYVKDQDRSSKTKGRGQKKGKGQKIPKVGGKVNKRGKR